MSPATVLKRTLRGRMHAAMPKAVARWLLPVPLSPEVLGA